MKRVLEILYYSGIMFILLFTNILLISSIVFIFGGHINVFNLIFSFILSSVEIFFLQKKNIINTFIAIIIFILIFVISLIVAAKKMDLSYDGNYYHKEAIGLLKNGWNPVYENSENLYEENNPQHSLWINHYPKATWIYGANIYKLTGNIETCKSFNPIIMFTVFTIILYLVYKKFNKFFISLMIAVASCSFPIILEQFYSLYLDGCLGFILLLTIIYTYLFIKDDTIKENYFILGSLLIILINIKYTGLLYGGLFCLGYYIYYIITKIRRKEIKELLLKSIYYIIILFIALIVVGSNSYLKNTIDHHNPLYPLVGKDKVDIMTTLQPASFKKMSPIEKNYYALFSRTANIGVFNGREPELKHIFTYDKNELAEISEDTRIGGFGPLFSGIFVSSLVIIIICLIINLIKKDYEDIIFIGIPFIITIILMFVFSDGWWARYSPQIYYLVLMALYLTLKNKHYFPKIIGVILLIITLYNSILINSNDKFRKDERIYIKQALQQNRNQKIYIYLRSNDFDGALYNLKDYNISYEIVDIDSSMQLLYFDKIFYKKSNK